MITVKIGKKKYKGFYRWDELPLKKYIELSEIVRPDGFDAFIKADGEFTSDNIDKFVEEAAKVTDQQLTEIFPAYYRKVIGCLTNISDTLEIPLKEVNDFFEYYFKPFVLTLVYRTPVIYFYGKITEYMPPEVHRFRIGMNYYYLPESVVVMDQVIPLKKESIISYSEASDIFRMINTGAVNRMALFMAIYCRKKNEAYSDDKALERERLFMDIPMSTVWAVFFCTLKHLPDFTLITGLFGELRKTMAETVSAARGYKSLEVGALSMK